VTLSPRARTATDLKVTAAAGRLIARQETTTISVRKPTKPGGGGGGADGSSGTCVRYLDDPSGGTGGSLILVPC
jgi:hypothetical protein